MKPQSILVVEDEGLVAKDLQYTLEEQGYQVCGTATNGLDAINKTEQYSPTIVLMDIGLPGELNGIETACILKERFSVAIVFLTAYADDRTVQEAKRAHPYGYISKPFSVTGLRRTITLALSQFNEDQNVRTQREEWLNTTLNSLDEAVITTDTEGCVTFVNPVAEQLTGWKKHQAMDKSISKIVSLFNEKTHRPVPNPVLALLTRGSVKFLNQSLLLQKRSGDEIIVDGSVANIQDKEGRHYGVAFVFRDVTERKKTELRLLYQAFHDELTGLSNRTALIKRMTDAFEGHEKNSPTAYVVLSLDVDAFRHINDSLGHEAGNRFLKELACRLESCLLTGDFLARLGGDEFSIFTPKSDQPNQIAQLIMRIQTVVECPFTLEGQDIYSSVSIGVATYIKGSAYPEEVLRDAETAMFKAKERGKGEFELFDQAMHHSVVNILTMENDFRRAIQGNQLELLYQPIVSLSTHEVFGFEALVRWHHPTKGLIMPGEFIEVAEETGLIIPLGDSILKSALHQKREWDLLGYADLSLSINVSASQFIKVDIVTQMKELLVAMPVDPASIRLELTESVFMSHSQDIIEKFSALSALGVQIAIDDFGTGYSCLAYLEKLPICCVKIDKSFIDGILNKDNPNVVILAIVAMAHTLGFHVVAEGVEYEEQLEYLRNKGVNLIQGYYFSKPLSATEALVYLKQKRHKANLKEK